jgi:protein SCO1
MKGFFLFAICVSYLAVSSGIATGGRYSQALSDNNGSKPPSGNSVYQLNSRWTDQKGKSTTLIRFQGKPLILAMIYTSCKDACPMIVLEMQAIEKALPQQLRQQTQFALISFDSERDSPAQLRLFEAAHGLDAKHWTLLAGSDDSVRMLAAVLGVRYMKIPSGEFAHSSVITVLDSNGNIQQQQTGLKKDPGEVVSAISSLLAHTK